MVVDKGPFMKLFQSKGILKSIPLKTTAYAIRDQDEYDANVIYDSCMITTP